MHNDVEISELWSLKLIPSDLYNIERVREDNPPGGGGHTYIQIPKGQVEPLLSFLHEKYPPNGFVISLPVGNRGEPGSVEEQVEFMSKSAGRMRIANQNRHRASRLSAWSPANGFPTLDPFKGTVEAREILKNIGQIHLYLARGTDGSVWAGYTKGAPTEEDSKLPFADILWGNSPGGYWKFEENNS